MTSRTINIKIWVEFETESLIELECFLENQLSSPNKLHYPLAIHLETFILPSTLIYRKNPGSRLGWGFEMLDGLISIAFSEPSKYSSDGFIMFRDGNLDLLVLASPYKYSGQRPMRGLVIHNQGSSASRVGVWSMVRDDISFCRNEYGETVSMLNSQRGLRMDMRWEKRRVRLI